MKIQLLGTGAAEGIPALYQDSAVSRYARKHGGKDLRSPAAAVIDDLVKVDFGPDTYAQAAREQLNPADWQSLFFTHSDDDHLCASELQYCMFPFTEHEFCPFPIFGNEVVIAEIQRRYPEWPFELITTRSFESVKWQDYTITPIKAYHKSDEDAQNLIFDDGKVKFLYGTDTGIWEDPTWEYLSGVQLDGMVLECTDGFRKGAYFGHLCLSECVMIVEKLREAGILKKDAVVATTHHSHLGEATHGQLEDALRPHGIEPGFDGMVLRIGSMSE